MPSPSVVPPPIAALLTAGDALVADTIALASLNSGSSHLAGLARVAGELTRRLRALTGDVQLIPVDAAGRQAVHARLRPAAPLRVLCSGHFDTVYPADHPFQSCDQPAPGRLRGPGVADMKGGLVTFLAALAAFESTPHAARLGWDVLLTPDEETGSAASRSVLEKIARQPFALGLVFEPARPGGELVQSRKGTGVFEITCHGRAAHAAADPAAGRNAILALASFLLAAARLPDTHPGLLLNVGRVTGGGPVNIVPDLASAALNVRVTTAADATAFLAALHALARPPAPVDGIRFEISGGFDRPPFETTPASRAAFAAWQAAALDLGSPVPAWIHAGGGSDANLLQAAGLPCLDGLGPVGGHLHSPDEYIETASLPIRAATAALVLHRLATGDLTLPPRSL